MYTRSDLGFRKYSWYLREKKSLLWVTTEIDVKPFFTNHMSLMYKFHANTTTSVMVL